MTGQWGFDSLRVHSLSAQVLEWETSEAQTLVPGSACGFESRPGHSYGGADVMAAYLLVKQLVPVRIRGITLVHTALSLW
jgi:hypothetical protein